LTAYDSYVYTPHKSVFYLLPKGFIPEVPGHQELFDKEKSMYFVFVSVVNFLRNYAMSRNTNGIVDGGKNHIEVLLSGLYEEKIITK